MKNFMFIFQGADYGALDMSPEQIQSRMENWSKWVAQLEKENRYVSGEALHPGGKLLSDPSTITDGPFAESKELVGGFFVIKANDLNEAIDMAKSFPDFDLGSKVQVQECVVFEE